VERLNILVINTGSSTLKCALFEFTDSSGSKAEPLWRGFVDWGRGMDRAVFFYTNSQTTEKKNIPLSSLDDSFMLLLSTCWEGKHKVVSGPEEISAVGHRVVHGGDQYLNPVRIDSRAKEQIQKLESLAPLHNPYNFKGILFSEVLFSQSVQYAVFDTSFHQTMSPKISSYPIPVKWRNKGIKKYGFHGISHRYCMEKAVKLLNLQENHHKIITCHLGSGCSLAASKNGICVDTTMGFTPLDGLMMGTRSGALDPGVILHLLREENVSCDQMHRALYHESGLLAMSGEADMRSILDAQKEGNADARLAKEMFVSRLKGYIGMMAASLDGLDILVFTGGIGENASMIRQEACEGLSHLGLVIDTARNRLCPKDGEISADGSSVSILVICTKEEYAIAKAVLRMESERFKKF